MHQRPTLLLLIPHRGGGGAEKVIALLAQNLARDKYDLHLGLVTESGVAANALGPGVTVHALGAARVRGAAWPLLALVRRLRPRLILSGIFHLNFLVLLLRPLFPGHPHVLVRQNGTIGASLAIDRLPAYTRLLYRLLYRRADRIICQSAAMAHDLVRELAVNPGRVVVLPNPVDVDRIEKAALAQPSLWSGPGPHLLAVGRLSPEKGFDLLLEAFAAVREKFPSSGLVIAGAGREEPALRALGRRLGLEHAVHFPGHADQPAAWFPGVTAFVLPSRHEGMPNALLEAAAGGLPLVATPASQGVVDLLRAQPGVWLAEDVSAAALAKALLAALAPLQPGQRFNHAFVREFRLERAVAAYEALLDATLLNFTK